MKRLSRRDNILLMNQADRDTALMFGKAPVMQQPVPPKRKASIRGASGVPLEREVLRAVWKYLAHHPKVAWISRFNSSAFQFEYGGKERWVRANYKRGLSDLLGQMKDGRLIACEVKAEGAQLMPHQRDFLNEVRRANGVAFVARNIADCIKELG